MGNRPPNGKTVRKEIILQEKLVLKPKSRGEGNQLGAGVDHSVGESSEHS